MDQSGFRPAFASIFPPLLHLLSFCLIANSPFWSWKLRFPDFYICLPKLLEQLLLCYSSLLCFILSYSIKQNQPFTLWIWFIFPTHLKGNFRWSLVSNLELTSSDLNKLWIMTTSLKKRKLEKRRTRKLKLTEAERGWDFDKSIKSLLFSQTNKHAALEAKKEMHSLLFSKAVLKGIFKMTVF